MVMRKYAAPRSLPHPASKIRLPVEGCIPVKAAAICRDGATANQHAKIKNPPTQASGLINFPMRLTLRELEAFAGAGLAVFLAFAGARIARKHAFRLQRRAQIGVKFQQRTGDAVARGAGLAVRTAAGDIHVDVQLVGRARDSQRLGNSGALGVQREIGFKRAAVDGDLAAAGRQTDTGDGGFATSGAEEFVGLGGHNKNYLAGASTAGFCASWLCFGPLKTFSLVRSWRPRRFFGIMPLTACSIRYSGCFARTSCTVLYFSPPFQPE